MSFLGELFTSFADALIQSSAYLLLGFFIAGLLRAFIPSENVVKWIGANKVSSVIKSAIFGAPLPLCSCSVVPVALSLKKSGAGNGATMSFLISTPETGIDSISLSYAMLNPIMTIFRPIAALTTAIIAGIAENILVPTKRVITLPILGNSRVEEDRQSVKEKVKEGLQFSFVDLMQETSIFLVAGLFISAIIYTVVPDGFFFNEINSRWGMMFIMLLAGVPMYVCASASTPIAAALIMKGISPGAALVFLLAGPATNFSTIGIVKKTMGTKSVVIYLSSISIVALGMGWLLDYFYAWSGLPVEVRILSHEHGNSLVTTVAAMIFIPWLFWSFFLEIKKRYFAK